MNILPKSDIISSDNRRKFHRLLILFFTSSILLITGLCIYYCWASSHARAINLSFTGVNASTSTVGDFSFSCTTSKVWEQDGPELLGAQYDGIITNNSNHTISNWKLTIPLTESVKIDSSWNGTFVQDGTTIIITPADYNVEIPAGKSIPIGMVYCISIQ